MEEKQTLLYRIDFDRTDVIVSELQIFFMTFFMRNTFETEEKAVKRCEKSLLLCEKKYSYVQTG